MKKVAIYTRVSTMEQANEGYSIEEQKNKLISFCDINDWPKYEMFVDAGVSGSTINRPALQDLLHRINEFDLVLVYKLDRLTRNVRNLLDLLDTFEKNNVAFRSATEVYDTTSAMGRLFVTLVGAMAEWERSTISERTEMGKTSAARKGVHVSKVPFYYTKTDGKLYPNEYAPVLRYMVKRIKEGASSLNIADELNASEYKHPKGLSWYPILVRRALKNPQARGHSFYGDIFVENTHEALISEDDFKIIEDKLKERTKVGNSKHTSIFRGKLKCPNCGLNLTLSVHHKKTKQGTKKYETYYCDKCKSDHVPNEQKVSFSMKRAEQAFIEYLYKLDFDKYLLAAADDNEPVIDVNKVNRQREKFLDAWSNDLISDDEFNKKMDETKKLLDTYYQQSNKKERNVDIEALKEWQNIVLESWGYLSNEDKEELINSTIKEIKYTFLKGNSRKNPSTIGIEDVIFYT